jgi:hypothetical protein
MARLGRSRGVLAVSRYLILSLTLVLTLLAHTSGRSTAWFSAGPVPDGVRSGAPYTRAQGEACTEGCRRQHSACLIRDKGSPACNSQLQRCLQNCLAGKRK